MPETARERQVREWLAVERRNVQWAATAHERQAACGARPRGHDWHYFDDHNAGAECVRCGLIDRDRCF